MSARRGIVVTVPPGVTQRAAIGFLEAKRSWVASALDRLAERHAHRERDRFRVPEEIVFPAAGERWLVERTPTDARNVRARRLPAPLDTDLTGVVRLSGDVVDAEACLRSLNRFVDARAREVLPEQLHELAEATGLRPASVRVRHQRTRWGSCSTAGAISLNRTLLFLPAELARSILMHELVHLLRHDHSPKFWAELERVDPDARRHRAELREAWRFVPAWAEAPHPRSNGDT